MQKNSSKLNGEWRTKAKQTPRENAAILHTHNLGFTQKPFEVVFLDIHQGGDVRDIKVVVFYMLGL